MKSFMNNRPKLSSTVKIFLVLSLIPVIYEGCSNGGFQSAGAGYSSSSSLGSIGGVPTTPVSASNPVVAGDGPNFTGAGNLTVATGSSIVARITNGLQGNVSSGTGNFAKSLAQVSGNLPKVPDPSKATGFDQAQLLIYAACSDLTTGAANSKMQTVYGVTAAGTVASNQSALVAAGTKILDQHLAGLASGSSAASSVAATFTTLVQAEINDTADKNTSTIAFMSVCIAANTAGTLLMGF